MQQKRIPTQKVFLKKLDWSSLEFSKVLRNAFLDVWAQHVLWWEAIKLPPL